MLTTVKCKTIINDNKNERTYEMNNEKEEIIKRTIDLSSRAERNGVITHTPFLTPAEQYCILSQPNTCFRTEYVMFGGTDACERRICFFLPEYIEKDYFDASEYISCIEIKSHFGTPGHRDYLGALLGMGVERDRLGDIVVVDNTAYIFCLPSVSGHLVTIEKVGRFGVTSQMITLEMVPKIEKQYKEAVFSVMSLRLDAVVGGMFNISRNDAAKRVSLGLVSLNYEICEKADKIVREGDIISVRGSGKGEIVGAGGTSRKGRTFVKARINK